MLSKLVGLLSDYLLKCQSEAEDAEVSFYLILNYFDGNCPCLGSNMLKTDFLYYIVWNKTTLSCSNEMKVMCVDEIPSRMRIHNSKNGPHTGKNTEILFNCIFYFWP